MMMMLHNTMLHNNKKKPSGKSGRPVVARLARKTAAAAVAIILLIALMMSNSTGGRLVLGEDRGSSGGGRSRPVGGESGFSSGRLRPARVHRSPSASLEGLPVVNVSRSERVDSGDSSRAVGVGLRRSSRARSTPVRLRGYELGEQEQGGRREQDRGGSFAGGADGDVGGSQGPSRSPPQNGSRPERVDSGDSSRAVGVGLRRSIRARSTSVRLRGYDLGEHEQEGRREQDRGGSFAGDADGDVGGGEGLSRSPPQNPDQRPSRVVGVGLRRSSRARSTSIRLRGYELAEPQQGENLGQDSGGLPAMDVDSDLDRPGPLQSLLRHVTPLSRTRSGETSRTVGVGLRRSTRARLTSVRLRSFELAEQQQGGLPMERSHTIEGRLRQQNAASHRRRRLDPAVRLSEGGARRLRREDPAIRQGILQGEREAQRLRRQDPAVQEGEREAQRLRRQDPAVQEGEREAQRLRRQDPAVQEGEREAQRLR
ncbi:unnamed protein product, partial [Ectocarpus fasciculatus]